MLVMIDEKTKIGRFFEKDEIITYKNISDLSEKIIKYSYDNNERSRIAKKEEISILNTLIQKLLQIF